MKHLLPVLALALTLTGIAFAGGENCDHHGKAAKAEMWPGSEVEYTVVRDAGKQRLTATLEPVPQEILAQWEAEAAEEDATRMAANE